MNLVTIGACFILITLAFGQSVPNPPPCTGCVCVEGDPRVSFQQGQQMLICVFVVEQTSPATYYRVVYPVNVDEFTMLTMTGSAQQLMSMVSAGSNVFLYIMGNDYTTPSYFNVVLFDNQFYTNTFNVVIRLNNGQVSNVIWDDMAGNNCTSPQIWNLTTSNTQDDDSDVDETCNVLGFCQSLPQTQVGLGPCDIKIFISFVGTDANGISLQSAGLRLSRFTESNVFGYQNNAMFVSNPETFNYPESNTADEL